MRIPVPVGNAVRLIAVRAAMTRNARQLRGDERKRMLFALKQAGYSTVRYWHENYAPRHFVRGAVYQYAAYSKYYRKLQVSRKSNRAPLVFTGNVRDRVLRPLQDSQLSGTANRTTATFQYGKPPAVVEKQQKFIARLVDTYGMTSAQATAAARAAGQLAGGYGREMKNRFQELITTVTKRESRELAAVFLKSYASAMRDWTRRNLGGGIAVSE